MERIKLTDNVQDIMFKMSDGNSGALTVLMKLLAPNKIDPDTALPGIGEILQLDSYGIYGTDIYVLWNDICRGDLVKMLTILRATQLGLFSSIVLADACHRQDYSGRALVPIDELYLKVKEVLPNFNSES